MLAYNMTKNPQYILPGEWGEVIFFVHNVCCCCSVNPDPARRRWRRLLRTYVRTHTHLAGPLAAACSLDGVYIYMLVPQHRFRRDLGYEP